jgi:hypothetical protein
MVKVYSIAWTFSITAVINTSGICIEHSTTTFENSSL